MTVEKLHDAIGLLPADLIAETDVKRTKKAKVIPRKRYMAMAACFVLILFGGLLFRSMLLPGFHGASKMNAYEAATQAAQAAPAEGAAESFAQEFGADSAGQAENSQVAADSQGNGAESRPGDTGSRDIFPAPEASNDFAVRYVKTPDNPYSAQCYLSGPGTTLVSSRAELDTYCKENQNQYLLEDFTRACETYDETWFEAHDLLLIALDAIVPAGGSVTVTDIISGAEGWEIHIGLPSEDAAGGYINWHILLETEKGLIPDAESVSLIFE